MIKRLAYIGHMEKERTSLDNAYTYLRVLGGWVNEAVAIGPGGYYRVVSWAPTVHATSNVQEWLDVTEEIELIRVGEVPDLSSIWFEVWEDQ